MTSNDHNFNFPEKLPPIASLHIYATQRWPALRWEAT